MTSTIKVNTIQNTCGADIIKESSNTITIGASGDTVALGSGASQTGFGRTGTVDWITTVQTTGFTAANGKGYFVNTTSGAISVALPAGSAGDIVAFKDYAGTWDTNKVTVTPNGTDKIAGINEVTELTVERQSVTLIFVDSTQGWLDIHDSTSAVAGSAFISATGGNTTATVDTNFKVHTFTSPGTFCVASGSGPKAIVDYLVIAGGGGGVHDRSGGGGAGGYREAKTGCNGSYTASPLANPTGVELSPGPYSITVGAGGAGCNSAPNDTGNPGSNSIFSSITSAGGGAGNRSGPRNGDNGGSGGGAGFDGSAGTGGSGNTPSVSPPQGNDGGDSASSPSRSGGGGGATAAGQPAASGKAGGAGATSSINGTPTARAGGGGGISAGAAGSGGGGTGGTDCGGAPGAGTNGTANTGGGAGGGASNTDGGNGGSGVVIIRYKFQ
jgi:hypothetical protein